MNIPGHFIHASSQDRLMMIHNSGNFRSFSRKFQAYVLFNEVKMQSSMTVKYKEQAANEYEESRDRK